MLEVYFGSDRKSVVDAAHAAAKKIPAEAVLIDEQTFAPGLFIDLISAASLFGEASVYLIDTPSSDTDFNEACLSAITDMAASQNHFFVIEGTLLAPVKKKYSKHASTLEEFTADKPERFNTFGMADALARKDKKSLWVMIQEAQLLGIREEEIIGILWWQLKAMRLAAVTSSASEAGMKDYPYRKAKQGLQKFSETDVSCLSNSLLRLYHEGHKGVKDLAIALERWVLSL